MCLLSIAPMKFGIFYRVKICVAVTFKSSSDGLARKLGEWMSKMAYAVSFKIFETVEIPTLNSEC